MVLQQFCLDIKCGILSYKRFLCDFFHTHKKNHVNILFTFCGYTNKKVLYFLNIYALAMFIDISL